MVVKKALNHDETTTRYETKLISRLYISTLGQICLRGTYFVMILISMVVLSGYSPQTLNKKCFPIEIHCPPSIGYIIALGNAQAFR